jgi:hypothetical protein
VEEKERKKERAEKNSGGRFSGHGISLAAVAIALGGDYGAVLVAVGPISARLRVWRGNAE